MKEMEKTKKMKQITMLFYSQNIDDYNNSRKIICSTHIKNRENNKKLIENSSKTHGKHANNTLKTLISMRFMSFQRVFKEFSMCFKCVFYCFRDF